MNKTLILIAPSEAKNKGGKNKSEQRHFHFDLPLDIVTKSTEKNLKCTRARYEEATQRNRTIEEGPRLPAIERYAGVQYQALDYPSLDKKAQHYLDQHVLICSAMYGLLKPQDPIANYKLPITTQLKNYRKQTITDTIKQLNPKNIINLLPGSYAAMIDWKQIDAEVTIPTFHEVVDGQTKVITHMVKKYRGYWLSEFIENRQDKFKKKLKHDKTIFVEYKKGL